MTLTPKLPKDRAYLVWAIVVTLILIGFSVWMGVALGDNNKKADLKKSSGLRLMTTACSPYKSNCSSVLGQHACCIRAALEVYAIVKKMLDGHGVNLVLVCGTLIGHQRHSRGVVPWDNDLDTAILESDVPALLQCKDELKRAYNIKLERHIRGAEGSDSTNPCDYYTASYDFKDTPSHHRIDIAILTSYINPFTNELFLLDMPRLYAQQESKKTEFWKTNKALEFKRNHFLPSKPDKMYDVDVYIPASPHAILADCYGSDVMTTPHIRDKRFRMPHENKVLTFLPAPILHSRMPADAPLGGLGFATVQIISDRYRFDRRAHMISDLSRVGLGGRFVDAVTPYTDLKEISRRKGTNCCLTEVGCALSHLKCYKNIASQPDSSWHLILEDDNSFRPDFENNVATMWSEVANLPAQNPPLGLLMLTWCLFNESSIKPVDGSKLLKRTGRSVATNAYAIQPFAARIILDKYFIINDPIDLVVPTIDLSIKESAHPQAEMFSHLYTTLRVVHPDADIDAQSHSNGVTHGLCTPLSNLAWIDSSTAPVK